MGLPTTTLTRIKGSFRYTRKHTHTHTNIFNCFTKTLNIPFRLLHLLGFVKTFYCLLTVMDQSSERHFDDISSDSITVFLSVSNYFVLSQMLIWVYIYGWTKNRFYGSFKLSLSYHRSRLRRHCKSGGPGLVTRHEGWWKGDGDGERGGEGVVVNKTEVLQKWRSRGEVERYGKGKTSQKRERESENSNKEL